MMPTTPRIQNTTMGPTFSAAQLLRFARISFEARATSACMLTAAIATEGEEASEDELVGISDRRKGGRSNWTDGLRQQWQDGSRGKVRRRGETRLDEYDEGRWTSTRTRQGRGRGRKRRVSIGRGRSRGKRKENEINGTKRERRKVEIYVRAGRAAGENIR
jgi:hypothetical protein